jgi:hypothetical protein
MSEVMLTIRDAHRAIHGTLHGSDADRVVSALSAEPETIEELEAAVARFIKFEDESGLFKHFNEGIREETWDAGIVIIDLAARLAASESSYSSLQKHGHVRYHNGSFATDVWVAYQVPDDWRFINHIEGWETLAQSRRDERAAVPLLDARQVIYGKVAEFIVKEFLVDSPLSWQVSSPRRGGREGSGWGRGLLGAVEPIAEIHARWLMTPRRDLRNRSPREVLLEKREFIDLDLQSRAMQWSFLDEPPPGLSPESVAYRFGGFGTHEYVLYYDLVRYLLETCWQRVLRVEDSRFIGEKSIDVKSEIERIERLKEDWLHTPQNDLHGMSPHDVIDRERRRLPVAVSAEHLVIDDDCPLCEMLAEDFAPTFWHLDGSHMDDDFPFSLYLTREEWEEEQRQWEEFDRMWEARHNNAREDESEPLI